MFLKLKFILLLSLLFCLKHPPVLADEIILNGNKRISKSTILEITDFDINKNYNESDLNLIQKKLFETNFFKKVEIEKKNNKIFVNLIENPIVDFFYIRGIKNAEFEEYLYDNLILGQNKLFSESLLNSDINFIKKYFNTLGYYNTEVKFEISQISNDNINLVFDIDRGDKIKINRILFIGDKFFSSRVLSDVVSSSNHGWWKYLSNSTNVNPERLNYDKNLLTNFYLNNGFYDVEIISTDVDLLNNNYANIIFVINSGKKYSFSNFEIIDENKLLTNVDLLNIDNLIKPSLKKFYSKKILLDIERQVNDYLDLKKIEFVDLVIETNKGSEDTILSKFIFLSKNKTFANKINISGNSITEEKVVRRELNFSEGDSITAYKIKTSIDNLKATGIFKNIEIKSKNVSNELVDIDIVAEEQPTGSVSAGISIGNSGSAIGTQLKEKNLFGSGIIADVNASFGTEKISGRVAYSIPDFNNSGNYLRNSFYALSTDYENAGYESKVIGFSASTEYDIFEDIAFNTGINIDLDDIKTTSAASELYKSRAGNYMTYKGYYGFSVDKRNRKFQPTEGYRFGFTQGLGLPVSDISFIENGLFATYYKPITENYTFNIKGGADSINALDNKDVKLSDRKFLNSSKLRGFESLGVGPKDGNDHIGGNYSAFLSLSSTFPNPIPEKWNAKTLLFIDAGNVWGVDYDDSLDSNKIRSSTGVSLEWVSPLGPISFTFAESLSSAPGDIEESFSFNIGGAF